MNFRIVKKYRIEIIMGCLTAAVYWISRLATILTLPIFTDEAIYVRWAQIAKQDSAQRFISLTDGKQPLFIWLTALLMKFAHDPLLAGRLVSVLAGFATMIGLYFLGREIFKNRYIGLFSALLYLFSPFGFVYDRMALYDSLVGTFAVWGLFVAILLVRKIRLDIAFILGLVVGVGMLNKTNAEGTLALLPATLLLFNWKKKDRSSRLIHWICYAAVAVILALGYYSILRLSPLFYMIAQKNTTFLYTFHEWLQHPFTFFVGNMHGLVGWFITYTTIPVVLAIIASFFVDRAYIKEKILLLIWFVVPMIYAGFFGKVLYPRYILFMMLSLLPLAAYTLYWIATHIKNTALASVCFLVIVFPSLYADYFILFNFARSPIPQSDLNQYINDWPAGGGVREAVQFFREQASNQKIFVGTEGTFGLMPYALEIYLVQNPNIHITGYWPINSQPPKELAAMAEKQPTYIIFYQPCPSCSGSGTAPVTWPVKLISKYQKGISDNYLSIYQIQK